MSVTQIDIINAAVLLIGAKKLFSTSDATKAARLASAMYELAGDEMFALPIIDGWKFARTRAQLAALDDDIAFGEYSYQYQLPPGYVRMLALCDVDDTETEYKWRRELFVRTRTDGEDEIAVLLTNQTPAYIRYVRRVRSEALWPAWFRRLVYINLAIILCEPLKQDKQKKNQLLVMLEDAKKDAEQANGLEDVNTDSNNVNLDNGNTDVIDAPGPVDRFNPPIQTIEI